MTQSGVKDISLSYFGLRRRTKFTKPWLIKDKFLASQNIFIDSGCHTINSTKEMKYTNEELKGIAEHYYSWIADNINEIEFYTEFDATQLGSKFLEEYRNRVRNVELDKFLPIWHADYGEDNLRELGDTYGRVGILQTAIGNRDLVPFLNRMASRGVKLHGLAMTKPDVMAAIPWESVSSTSWISPMQYGDTIIWSHNQLKRYPMKMKDQARRKERSTFISAGFDIDKIYNDDGHELLRVSLWSWMKQLEAINKKQGRGVTAPVDFNDDSISEFDSDEVGTVVDRVQKRVPTAIARNPSEKHVIPFLNFDIDVEKRKNRITGETEDYEVPKIRIRSESMRICDTCFLADKCPMFAENTTCAYDIPIELRTKEQVQSAVDAISEMQLQRILFLKMAEDAQGGYADPVLSSEIDRFNKLIKTKHDMEQEGFSLTVTAKQQGQMSMVNRIFGDMTSKSFTELPAAVDVSDVVNSMGMSDFIDAEEY
jgi:hypothetical protein